MTPVRKSGVQGICCARESAPQVAPPGVIVLFGPLSTIRVMPERVAP